MKVSNSVPMIAGKMPPFVMPSVGNDVMNCSDILEKPFEKISHMMIMRYKHTIDVLPSKRIQLKV
jgi:hypothetical protein